ncbi:MAG TPA: PKD domain-containing protein [Thermoanaerobaculia bacterium]|jgi:PKD repeat protein|nr:PKD domain-containing protein [Thermoanaerobaculia bacterium]
MLKFVRNAVIGLLFCAVPATRMLAQKHPMPGPKSQPNVICTGCPGTNTLGQENDGLPTYPYSSPIIDHTGRYVDSSIIAQYMHIGIRTIRAQVIRVAKNQRGAAPPRIYIQLGSAIGAYSLDSFFSTKLPGGMISIGTLFGQVALTGPDRVPPEKMLKWDGFVYPEASNTGWYCPFQDGVDRLGDFDFDDRGNLYAAYTVFGWGILKDAGETNAAHLKTTVQMVAPPAPPKPGEVPRPPGQYEKPDTSAVTPETIFVFKTGSKYYAVISDKVRSTAVWDVTDPANPRIFSSRPGEQNSVRKWDRDDENGRVAFIDYNNRLHVYDYATYISGGPALVEQTGASGKFIDVSFDESGNLWATESKNNIWKFTKSGNGYSSQMFSPFGGTYDDIKVMHASDGFILVAGTARTPTISFDLRLLRIEATGPRLVDTDDFFKKYYHEAPSHYAEPGHYAGIQSDVQVVKWNGKTYVMYSVFGLGDVFEIEGSDSISIKRTENSFGTPNPNSKGTPGPYVGDIVTFSAPSSNPQVLYDNTWDFGNPEVGTSENQAGPRKSNLDVSHQYSALPTTALITAPKLVRAVTIQDSTIASQFSLTLKVPTPRIGISGVTAPIASNPTNLEVVAGQTFNDASDGSKESHYTTWTIDGTPTKLAPDQSIPTGAVGPHTMVFQTAYGKYDASFNGTSPYLPSPLTFSYTVRPFKVSLKPPTADTTNVTFSATGLATSDTSIITGTQWAITWTFTPAGGGTPTTTTQTVAIGTVPNFTILKNQVTTGSTVSVQAVVNIADLSVPAQPYATHTDSMTLTTADPAFVITGCANASSPCKFTASSVSGALMSDWTFAWTLKLNGVTVKTGTSNPYEPSITAPGDYTISLKATKSIFDTVVEKSFTAGASLCASLPPTQNVGIAKVGCTSGCTPGTKVTFWPTFQGYTAQSCDVFSWNFGSGEGSATGLEVEHTYASAGNYTVTLTITQPGTNNTPLTKTTTISVSGGGTDGGGNTCTAPTSASITYGGTSGCNMSGTCRTTETITFTARRGVNNLQTCDTVNWTFSDNTTSTQRNPQKLWSTPGTYTAKMKITNTKGTSQEATTTITVVTPPSGNCSQAPGPGNFAITFSVPGGCTNINGNPCNAGESIAFENAVYNYTTGSCDNFEWDFGDGTPKVTTRNATHTFAAANPSGYPVKFRVYNNAGSFTYTKSVKVAGTVATKPIPVLTATTFPSAGTKNKSVTFTASSDMPTTTGWTWNFGDGTASDSSQAGNVSQTSTITHTFTKLGNSTVRVTARNSEDAPSAPTGSVQATINVTDAPAIPEFRYLLPVAVHAKGQFNSTWRTDVQIYNPDQTFSVANPLNMIATFKGREYPLEITKSTVIYEDFLGRLLDHDDQGPVIITTKNTTKAPQIWTRTYNQNEAGGTFGQFIPAIRLDTAGSGGAVDPGTYFLSGLRHDDRYRANIGFLNPNAAAVTATVTVYDERRLKLGEYTETLQPFQLVQYALKSKETASFKLPATAPFSVKITIPAGSNWLIAYASFIDGISNDPVFLQAVRESDVASADYKVSIVPGVGHTGAWRSDVTIFNPDVDASQFDLQYYNSAGEKKGEALGIVLDSGKFLQYGDLLKQGVLGNVEDGFGMMKLTVKSQHEKYPMTFARTYFDDLANGTYGQGIGAFATARANVKPNKPALIPGVRNNSSYQTNIGLVNVSAVAVTAKITLLDPITGAAAGSIDYPLAPNQSILGNFNGFGSIETGALKIEATGDVWAFCSIIDKRTKDPEYVPATPLQ